MAIARVRGALAGWKRSVTDHGVVVTVQVATTPERFQARDFDEVQLALNDRQLRSFARDLARAARERGMELAAPRRWWSFARE